MAFCRESTTASNIKSSNHSLACYSGPDFARCLPEGTGSGTAYRRASSVYLGAFKTFKRRRDSYNFSVSLTNLGAFLYLMLLLLENI